MAHLIDKDALVAEIERKKKYAQTLGDNAINGSMQQFYDGMKQGCVDLLSSLDTLEVKEVDFDTEIYDYIDELFNVYDDGNQTLQTKDKNSLIGRVDVENIAKHFFELGMCNTITEEDCKLIWNIGDEIPNMPEEEFFKELLKRYKAQREEEV